MSVGSRRRSRSAILAIVSALAVLSAACGDGSNDAEGTDSNSGSTVSAAAEPAADEHDDGSGAAHDGNDAATTVIAHKFGEAAIETRPERVITLGYSEQDPVLALGVMPVAVREWFGGHDHATWPWAQDELGTGAPEVMDMPYGELNYEAIAALEPDLIVATHAGITQEEYDLLAAIAPTIAETDDAPSFGMAWQDQTRMIGQALGLDSEADQAVKLTEDAVADAARANGGLAGASFAWANPTGEGTYWVVGANTPPMRFLQDLGLAYPEPIADVVGEADSLELSGEQIAILDVDVLIVQASEEIRAEMETDPLWQGLDVMSQDRIVWLLADDPIYGALSFSTVLSIDYLVDELTPMLTAILGPAAEATNDPNAVAAMEAFAVVYDSAAAWADKASHLEDAANLETSNEGYRQAGDGVGGIALEPTGVTIDGDTATVTYDVLFGKSSAYQDLTRTITLIDSTWVVSRADYCDFLSSARAPCTG